MADTTTIEIKVSTWQELNQQKQPGDSFDDVVRRLLADDGESPPPETPGVEPAAAADAQVALGDDLPQAVEPEEAREVVAAVLDVIDAHGPLERSDIVDALGEEHSLGYDMSNRDGAWWKRIVNPSIKANGAEYQAGRGWTR